MSQPGDRQTDETGGGRLRSLVIKGVVATLLASAVAMVGVARTVYFSPKVGDILVFRIDTRLPADWEFVAVTSSDQLPVTCKLQPAVMASAGGSLVVEQQSHNRRLYRVHWAGRQTSNDNGDCGPAADLLLARGDLQLLSHVVGGPGVERRRLSWFWLSSS